MTNNMENHVKDVKLDTQTDWEKELLQALVLDIPPVEVMFIKGVQNLVRTNYQFI